MNPPVNRSLKDKALDHIDHALGRPTWPLRESYRNYFATPINSRCGLAFDLSPHWQRGKTIQGDMVYFHVTQAGREALAAHLASIGADRVYAVSFDGHDERPVTALTRAKARYQRFLEIRDFLPDISFVEFVQRCHVRIAT